MAKKYAGLDALRTFLDNLKNTFAALNHAHKISDLTDYTVDKTLSTTSTNPLQNKVVTEKINSANSTISSIYNRVKNRISYLARTQIANTALLKIGTFTGDGSGGRAIITLNGKKGWNYKNDGGLKVLTLSSNSPSPSDPNGICTGATFYDFGGSNDDGSEILDSVQDIQILLVRPQDYAVREVDVYIKFSSYQYNSFFVTVDYSDGCSWNTDVQAITTTDTDPTTNAMASFVVPKKIIGDNKELKTPKEAATSTDYTAPYCQSGITVSDLTGLKDYRTTIGVVYDSSNNTHSTISLRHRNGASNGKDYGMYITAPLKTESNLKWRNQVNGNWGTEKTLLDSSNFTDYIPYETGTCALTGYNHAIAGDGTVIITNATYHLVGKMVTVHFTMGSSGGILIDGLPYAATKGQTGVANASSDRYYIASGKTFFNIDVTDANTQNYTITYFKS